MEKRNSTTVSVHRCRFVDYAPSAITALAFPPLPLPSIKGKKKARNTSKPIKFGLLAVGHANGNIDLCEWMGSERDVQCPQAWVVRKILSGPYPSKVDSLSFIIRYPDDLEAGEVPQLSQLRLFSSGGGSDLVEWDLERGCIRRTISSQGGSIWSIAANPGCSYLALGCEDGTVRLLSVANDTLTHARRFDRVKSRILSIAWGPPVPKKPSQNARSSREDDTSSDEEDEDEWKDSWLVTGCSDSSLRKWDIAAGNVSERMGVDKVRGERTLVWTVGVLGDGTIVSGDSLGSVKFWDARTCTQLYSFQAHGADVLCMTISSDGKQLYTAGVDQKTIQFSLVKTSSPGSSTATTRWTQTSSKRMHSHDIRALAIWPPYTPLPAPYTSTLPHFSPFSPAASSSSSTAPTLAPVLASGGLDMTVVLTPAAPPISTLIKTINPLDTSTESTFEDAYHRKLSYVRKGSVKVARAARLVSCAREAGISIWRIRKKADKQEHLDGEDGLEEQDFVKVDGEPDGPAWEKVLEMDLKVHSNIIAHDISDDGKWLVVSDLYESKLFSLRSSDATQLSLKRSKTFPTLLSSHIPRVRAHLHSTGSSAFAFTPDSSKLILATALSAYVFIIDLSNSQPKLLRKFEQHRLVNSSGHNMGRAIAGKLAKKPTVPSPKVKAKVNGIANGDVEMGEPTVNGVTGSESESEEEASRSGMEEDETSNSSDDEDVPSTSEQKAVVSIDRLAVSTDGQWLASSDNKGRTHIFNLDSISHHTLLPSFPAPIQSLTFDTSPSQSSTLLLCFANNTIAFYDVESRHFPSWGKDLAASLPKRIKLNHEVVLGATFEPFDDTQVDEGDSAKSRYLLLWGSTWLFKISLDPRRRTSGGGKKRRRDAPAAAPSAHDDNPNSAATWWDFKTITQYRPILSCEFLSKHELVVVERPLVDVLLTLPPAYFKHKYGSS